MTRFYSWIYRREIATSQRVSRLWRILRKLIIKFAEDPICEMVIHERKMLMPLSHPLPRYLRLFPYYDSLVGRVAAFIRQRERLVLVDVGANIGDTIAASHKQRNDVCIAIEPDPAYRRLLEKNWRDEDGIVVLDAACGASTSIIEGSLETARGTGAIRNASGCHMQIYALNDVLKSQGIDVEVNMLKIDTDGHDVDVLLGASSLIEKFMPVVLIECDCWGSQAALERYMLSFQKLNHAGYESLIMYDHTGLLLGKFELTDVETLRGLMRYQYLRSGFYYDALLMCEEAQALFYMQESQVFSLHGTEGSRGFGREGSQ
jgi:FkbM family methyltransferase